MYPSEFSPENHHYQLLKTKYLNISFRHNVQLDNVELTLQVVLNKLSVLSLACVINENIYSYTPAFYVVIYMESRILLKKIAGNGYHFNAILCRKLFTFIFQFILRTCDNNQVVPICCK